MDRLAPTPKTVTSSIVIEGVGPAVDGGRYPVKREVGDAMEVSAHILKEGHDILGAEVLYRRAEDAEWSAAPMAVANSGLDRWTGRFMLAEVGAYVFTVRAWTDHFASWLDEIDKKTTAGQDVSLELLEGATLVKAAAARAEGRDAKRLGAVAAKVEDADDASERLALMLSPDLAVMMARWPDLSGAATCPVDYPVTVDRVAARFASWYEMVPRSQGTDPTRSATFDDCIARLPAIQAMGFDVVYLTPIHPIGEKHRKGPNNTLKPGPNDPGSFYAVGSRLGGHTAVHPELGTLDDFDRFVAEAAKLGLEVALDIAIQCAPDHPWIKEHPEWFKHRPDGTIKYAENPPKKYQDIVNLDFWTTDREGLWTALRDVFLFWIDHGVKTFRVDNPHTKPLPFWEWCIGTIKEDFPDVVFLSEAFTRPNLLKALAKVGFSQSYTYFTWRNFKPELTEFMDDMARGDAVEYLRPNLFPATPDILPEYLQRGGRPAHLIRAVLAATLSSAWGMLNGYELCENEALPGTEDYKDSEKYQFKVRDWTAPGNLIAEITTLNRVRRDNPALREFQNLRFHYADNDNVLFFSKMTLDRSNMVFVAVNLDPFDVQDATLHFPLFDMGLHADDTYAVEEMLSGTRHMWTGERQTVTLDPATHPAAIYRIEAWRKIDYREPCF